VKAVAATRFTRFTLQSGQKPDFEQNQVKNLILTNFP